MKERINSALQQFSRALLQPVMYIAIASIPIAITSILTNVGIEGPVGEVIQILYDIFNNGILNNLSIIFCVAIAAGLAKTKKTDAAVIAMICYFIFLYTNNGVLRLTGKLLEECGNGTGQAIVLGMQVVDCGVFGGIILGTAVGVLMNKLRGSKSTGIFGGSSIQYLVCVFAVIAIAAIFAFVWPIVADGISALVGVIDRSGGLGVFLYGFLNRLLIPTGLHHLIYIPFTMTEFGGTMAINGVNYIGAMQIYMGEVGAAGSITTLHESAKYLMFGFSKMFGYIGVFFAFLKASKPENRKRVKKMLLPALLVAVLGGITEPFDFIFLFAAPAVWVTISLLDGLFQMFAYFLGCKVFGMGGITFTVLSLSFPFSATKLHLWYILGIVGIIVWYFIIKWLIIKFDLKTPGREDEEAKAGAIATDGDIAHIIKGLGGVENIVTLENCFTRLRVEVKDADLINKDEINHYPNTGIIVKNKTIQIIIGLNVEQLKDKIHEAYNL